MEMADGELCGWPEGISAKIGKVKRIKFYKDERGGLKVQKAEPKRMDGCSCLHRPVRREMLW